MVWQEKKKDTQVIVVFDFIVSKLSFYNIQLFVLYYLCEIACYSE